MKLHNFDPDRFSRYNAALGAVSSAPLVRSDEDK